MTAAREGWGTFVVLSGPSGTGKTRLLAAAGRSAADLGAQVLYAMGSTAEQKHAGGVLGQLLGGQSLSTGLPSDGANASRLQAGDESTPAGISLDHRRMRELAAPLLQRPRSTPLVLLVDNVAAVDRLSLDFLLFLSRRLHQAPVVLVLAMTSTPDAECDWEMEMKTQPHCREIRLKALGRAEMADMVTSFGGPGRSPESAVDAWFAITGGNPALIASLRADQLSHPSDPAGVPVVGTSFRQAVRRCLERSGPDVLAIGPLLAAPDRATTTELAERMRAISSISPGLVVNLLNDMGFLERDRMREPVRSALSLCFPETQRQSMQLRIAERLHAFGQPAHVVAPHLLAAGHTTHPWAVDVLVAEADQARLLGERKRAGDYVQLAHRLCDDERRRAELTLQLCELAWTGDLPEAGVHLARLSAALHQNLLPTGRRALALEYLLGHRPTPELARLAVALFENRDVTGPEDESARDLLQLRLRTTYPVLAAAVKQSMRRDDALRDPVGAASAPPDRPLGSTSNLAVVAHRRAENLLAAVLSAGSRPVNVEEAESLLERARPSESNDAYATPALQALLYTDRLDAAARWSARLSLRAEQRATSRGTALFTAVRAEVSLRLGDIGKACDLAEQAWGSVPWSQWGAAVGSPAGTLIRAYTACGRHEQAAALVARPVPLAMFDTRYGLEYLFARSHYLLAVGEHHAALADALRCGQLMKLWGFDQPGFLAWQSAAISAWLHLDERDRARVTAQRELDRLSDLRGRSRGLALRAVAATSEPVDRPDLLLEAADVLRESGAKYELALVHAELAETYEALGKPVPARTSKRQAHLLAVACRATRLANQLVTPELEQPGPQMVRQASKTLSDAELRVAALAAQGRTNREISERLFITVSTVEQHLTRIYRKLQVKQRSDLGRALPSPVLD